MGPGIPDRIVSAQPDETQILRTRMGQEIPILRTHSVRLVAREV